MTNRPLRHERTRDTDPCSVPLPVPNEHDLVLVDTTWGKGPSNLSRTCRPSASLSSSASSRGAPLSSIPASLGPVPGWRSPTHSASRTTRSAKRLRSSPGARSASCSATARNAPRPPGHRHPARGWVSSGVARLLPRRRLRLGDSGLSDSPRVAAATGSPWCVSEQPCVGFKGPSRRCTELSRRRQCRKCPRRPCPSQPWLLPSSPDRSAGWHTDPNLPAAAGLPRFRTATAGPGAHLATGEPHDRVSRTADSVVRTPLPVGRVRNPGSALGAPAKAYCDTCGQPLNNPQSVKVAWEQLERPADSHRRAPGDGALRRPPA